MTIAHIDRMFFEHLRREIVLAGLLPDIATLSEGEFKAARATIIADTDKQLVEIYGVGTGDTRGLKDFNQITIDRGKQDPGSLGGSGLSDLMPDGVGGFNRVAYGDKTRNINYEIRTVSQSTAYHRVLDDIISYTLGEMRYLSVVNEFGQFTDEKVLVEFDGSVDVSSTSQFIETLHRFVVRDVWVGREKILTTGIKPMSSVDYFVYLKPEPGVQLLPDVTIKLGNDGL